MRSLLAIVVCAVCGLSLATPFVRPLLDSLNRVASVQKLGR